MGVFYVAQDRTICYDINQEGENLVSEADGYYGDDEGTSEELDLSFLDEK